MTDEEALNVLVPQKLLSKLRAKAQREGVSENELVVRALHHDLEICQGDYFEAVEEIATAQEGTKAWAATVEQRLDLLFSCIDRRTRDVRNQAAASTLEAMDAVREEAAAMLKLQEQRIVTAIEQASTKKTRNRKSKGFG